MITIIIIFTKAEKSKEENKKEEQFPERRGGESRAISFS
jgi:hypothetical protein